jgi:hypothetical protein
MANAYLEVDSGLTVSNVATGVSVTIDGLSGNITTTGNLQLTGTTTSYNATSVMPKSYVDNMAVVFGV